MNTDIAYRLVSSHALLYYIIISVIGVLFFYYIRKDKFSILLFLIFFSGVFDYWGDLANNLYKFLILALTILLYFDTKKSSYINVIILIVFFLFSFSFWISISSNQNPFLYSFSQYSKFLIPFIVFMFLINNMMTRENYEYYLRLVVKLILLQVLFSIIKFFTIGFSESIVGSVSFMGGNTATILPILGYMIMYFLSNGKIRQIEIIQIASMLLISIMSFKRIIWFLFPIVILGLNINSASIKYLKYAIIIIPIILYTGIRLNPTLNKEKKIWGSFDLDYAIQYSQDYYGVENTEYGRDKSEGRFAGNALMIKYIGANLNNYNTWFGFGPKLVYGISYTDYAKRNWPWRIFDKGSLTGAARFFISYGLLGMILYLCLMISFLINIKFKRFKVFVIILFLFEFFFYLDTFIELPIIISVLLLSNYLSHNLQSDERIKFFMSKAQNGIVQ